jgi:hypothetical protein
MHFTWIALCISSLKDSLKSKHCLECFKIGLIWNLIGISFIFSETRYTLMKKDYLFKIQIMIDTKMITNTKKNTPFDIISQMHDIKQVTSIKNYKIYIGKMQ